ncbi:MAG TPA: M1 family metallopeptidase [Caulobacteraceae bacterium]|jgi:aminopeptidase N
MKKALGIAGLVAATLSVGVPVRAAQPAEVDVLHHHVALEPDFETQMVTSRTRLTLRVVRPGDRVEFTANGMVLNDAQIGGRPAQVDRSGPRLGFIPARPLKAGQRIVVEATQIGTPSRGLTFVEDGLYTAYHTCDWTVCDIDRPGDKATFSLELTVPAGFVTVATGEPGRVTRTSGLGEVHRWRERRPYSNYLYGFAAGRFAKTQLKHGRVELPVLSSAEAAAQVPAMFRDTGAMLAFFEEKAGLPLPHRRYTQVLVPGGAAQEASSFSLLGEATMKPILETPQEDWAIAHELAHQWWGNLVTNESWDHFWLNEGITTFMVAAWKEKRWGRPAYDREMELARGRRARAAEAGFDKPLAYAGAYPSLPLRRAVTYSKGALFMDELRQKMGEAAFWAGLRRFTRTHAGGTVDSRDFQRAMQAESGEDLAPLFDSWVHPGGAAAPGGQASAR